MKSHTAKLLILLSYFLVGINCDQFEKAFQWKQLTHQKNVMTDSSDITFGNELQQNSINESFVSYNNIPMGATYHRGRLFIAVPRRRPGVPATLNVIDTTKISKGEMSPPLQAYPEYLINQLHRDYRSDLKRIVSVYRTKVDVCDRLWFVDTGMLEYPDNRIQVQRPQLWIIDLARDRKVRTFEIPESIVREGIGMASLTLDVEEEKCDKTFAYIPDLIEGAIYVYSFEANRMWSFNHSSFQQDPSRANFNVAGLRFEWDDGIFSIALGKRDPVTNAKAVYYHPMVSTSEFVTDTGILQSEVVARLGSYERSFQRLGERGPNSQSTMHHFDDDTGVLFYANVNKNSISCWNTQNNFTAENHDIVDLDHREMIYPTDLNADVDGTIWVLTNNLPTWIYSRLDENQFNFHVWRQTPRKAIIGTKCAN